MYQKWNPDRRRDGKENRFLTPSTLRQAQCEQAQGFGMTVFRSVCYENKASAIAGRRTAESVPGDISVFGISEGDVR